MSFEEMERRAVLEQKFRDEESQRVVKMNDGLVLRRLSDIENKLREIIKDEGLTDKTRGQLGNLLGDLKDARRADLNSLWSMTHELREFLQEFRSDPVIRAYLNQKAEWKTQIHELRNRVRAAFSALDEPYDD